MKSFFRAAALFVFFMLPTTSRPEASVFLNSGLDVPGSVYISPNIS